VTDDYASRLDDIRAVDEFVSTSFPGGAEEMMLATTTMLATARYLLADGPFADLGLAKAGAISWGEFRSRFFARLAPKPRGP
jgi:hypothetical protein